MIEWKTEIWFVKAYAEEPWSTRGKSKEKIVKMRRRKAEELMAEIKRHCDNYTDLEIDLEGHYECTFCGATVATKDDIECCDESVEYYGRQE